MLIEDDGLERGRELYNEIFGSQLSTDVLAIVNTPEGRIDDILYAIFHDCIEVGFLTDITGVDMMYNEDSIAPEDILVQEDGSPLYAITAMKLRTLMCAALTVGIWHQKVTNNLDTIWGVDKNST